LLLFEGVILATTRYSNVFLVSFMTERISLIVHKS